MGKFEDLDPFFGGRAFLVQREVATFLDPGFSRARVFTTRNGRSVAVILMTKTVCRISLYEIRVRHQCLKRRIL